MKKGKKERFVKTSNSWRFRGNEVKYVREVLDSGFGSSTSGNMNQRYERAFAERLGTKFAVTSNSGTSTLHQAIMPVHLYGQVCDMRSIMRIAKKYTLAVVEDCAQCYLGTDGNDKLAGTIGDVGSFSTENSKHISTGDGGILVTNSEVLALRMRKFGGMGFKNIKALSGQVRKNKDTFQDPEYLRHDTFGYNYRLPEVAAAIGLAQVERISFLVKKRQQIAAKYLKALKRCDWIIPQTIPKGYVNSYYTFAVRYEGEKKRGVSWYDFRKKFMEFGGDGIYSAWALVYNEPIMRLIHEKGRFFPD